MISNFHTFTDIIFAIAPIHLPRLAACTATAFLILGSPGVANAVNSAIGEVDINIEYDPGLDVTFTLLEPQFFGAGDGSHLEDGRGIVSNSTNSYSINFFAKAESFNPPLSRSVSAAFISPLGVFASFRNNTNSSVSFNFISSILFDYGIQASDPGDAFIRWSFKVSSSLLQPNGEVSAPVSVIDYTDDDFAPYPLGIFFTYSKEETFATSLPPGSSQSLSLDQAFIRARARNVPGPLPILGLGVVFGYTRKLRKLFKASKPELISPIYGRRSGRLPRPVVAARGLECSQPRTGLAAANGCY
jgi:hypothetical protein